MVVADTHGFALDALARQLLAAARVAQAEELFASAGLRLEGVGDVRRRILLPSLIELSVREEVLPSPIEGCGVRDPL